MTRSETDNLIESLLQAYKDKHGNLGSYGAFSGFMMSLSGNLLSDMSLGGDYWIKKIQEKIEELKS